jgi:hypothetical protein
MCLRSWLKGFSALAALLVAPALLIGGTKPERPTYPPIPAAYMWSFPNEASSLLKQLRTQALQVRDSADQLQAFNRDGADITWQADASLLTRVRAQVNDMNATLFRLRGIHQMALPWQQRAISAVTPKVFELTEYVDDAIQNLNDHHATVHVLDKSYVADADFMYQRANTIARSISQFEEYATAKTEIQQLSPNLGMNPAS